MLSRRGARVVHGPTMATTLLDDLDATIEATRAGACRRRSTSWCFTTGIGVRSWFAAAESLGLDEDLSSALGAGARRRPRARRRSSGPVGGPGRRLDGADRDERTRCSPARPRRASPGSGSSSSATAARRCSPTPSPRSARRGRRRAGLPVEHARRRRRRRCGCSRRRPIRQLDAVTFTCSYAVHNAFELSRDPAALAGRVRRRRAGRRRRPGHRPRPARRRGSAGSSSRSGPGSVRWSTPSPAASRSGRRSCASAAAEVRWQGLALIDPDGTEVELTRGEARLLSVLVRRAPTVVPKVGARRARAPTSTPPRRRSPGCGPSSARSGRGSAPSAAAATPARSRSTADAPPRSRLRRRRSPTHASVSRGRRRRRPAARPRARP